MALVGRRFLVQAVFAARADHPRQRQESSDRLAPPGPRPAAEGAVSETPDEQLSARDAGYKWKGSPPEDVRGFDARSGKLLWTFHVVPREGEFGAETWGNGSGKLSGDLGSWCCISADEELGYVYVPLTAPTAAYYGG